MIKKLLFTGCFFCTTVLFATPQNSALNARIQQIIKAAAPNASNGLLFLNSKTGKILYQHNADQYFAPASVTKLFTAIATLYHLGTDYTYNTQLLQKNNNIYLRFVGDPSLTINNLTQLIQTLKTQRIKGDFILDTTYFQAPDYPPGLTYEDLGWYYAAPVTSVILNDNAVSYNVNSNVPFHDKPIIQAQNKQEANLLQITNNIRVVDTSFAKEHCALAIDMHSNNAVSLYGCTNQKADPYTQKLAIPNPTLLAKQVIQKTLEQAHIALDGKIRLGSTPENTQFIASHQSKPLQHLITTMLQESDNTYANSFAKTLGHAITGEGSFKQSIFAIKQILKKHTAIDVECLDLSDGAGNRLNLLSPRLIAELLMQIQQKPALYAALKQSLPKAGIAGNLQYRMQDEALKGRVIAKTGTMHDIVTLAGYLYPQEGDAIVFVMMTNQMVGDVDEVRTMQESILKHFL